MPDHVHLVWMGMRPESDQRNAMTFLRTGLEPALGEKQRWQHQPHDHVLREEERKQDAFSSACYYVLQNPVRAGLVRSAEEWQYLGAVLPGYPDVHPLRDGFWDLFWKLYVQHRIEYEN